MKELDRNILLAAVRVKLKLKKTHIPAVAIETGINDSTLRRIRDGVTSRPEAETIYKIAKHYGIK